MRKIVNYARSIVFSVAASRAKVDRSFSLVKMCISVSNFWYGNVK